MDMHKRIARYLLQSKAIKLDPTTPFTWASGWKSPIYCDNRKTLSFPEIRGFIRDSFSSTIKELYPDAEVIAGVATGAIAQGVLVADMLDLPFIYVRSEAKNHGLSNLIEGVINPGQKVVVIEDLISTGRSSLKVVHTLREHGCKVLGMIAIFNYGFPQAEKNFVDASCRVTNLSDYKSLLEIALEINYITSKEAEILQDWRLDPENWKA